MTKVVTAVLALGAIMIMAVNSVVTSNLPLTKVAQLVHNMFNLETYLVAIYDYQFDPQPQPQLATYVAEGGLTYLQTSEQLAAGSLQWWLGLTESEVGAKVREVDTPSTQIKCQELELEPCVVLEMTDQDTNYLFYFKPASRQLVALYKVKAEQPQLTLLFNRQNDLQLKVSPGLGQV